MWIESFEHEYFNKFRTKLITSKSKKSSELILIFINDLKIDN